MVYYLPSCWQSVELEQETPHALYLNKKVSVYIPNYRVFVVSGCSCQWCIYLLPPFLLVVC